MTIQAVIFDMDGVLVDSEVYWGISREEFARDLGKEWTDAHQRLAMGQSTVGWAKVMQERLEIDWTIDDIIADMKRRVIAHYEERMPTRDGALEAVRLASEHFRVGLASGSPTEIIKHVMQLTGLDQIFEEIVYGDDIPKGKPAPDIYIEAMKRMGVTPEVSVGIEDSANGIRSLKAAGMYAIAAPSPAFPLPDDIKQMADAHITEMTEFSVALVNGLG
ncbi:MAG: HAD family phosphatase [Aggregatilineales bacterium]